MSVVPSRTVSHYLDVRHYLGGTGRGFAWSDEYGVLVLAKPTARYLPQDGTWLELVRWCLEGIPNGGSRQWSQVARYLRAERPEVTTVVSYSDPSVGHTGALYKACNWRWAPTWHRLRPPPTGNGSWRDGAPQSVKDRWVFELRPDPRRAELLAVKDAAAAAVPGAASGRMITVAALYVEPDGVYANLPGVEVWDEARDARLYAGPWPVVAHPPCARWCRTAGFVEKVYGHKRGDDGGCFAAALEAVRTFGGVLEHPAHSDAWDHFGLPKPQRVGHWRASLLDGGWSAWVDQGWYGHALAKPTWIYAYGVELAAMQWGIDRAGGRLPHRDPTMSATQRQRMTIPTPPAFRDVLLEMARSAAVAAVPGTAE